MYPEPPLQNQGYNILVRARFYPILLTGEIEKAFLQVHIKEEERDSLRFFWQSPNCDVVLVYRLSCPIRNDVLAISTGVINQHLKI